MVYLWRPLKYNESMLDLTKIKKIIHALNSYSGKAMDFESITKYVTSCTGANQGEIAQVIEFLQELKLEPAAPSKALVISEGEIDLGVELAYNYNVAKAVLQDILDEKKPDKEEIRKTLTTIQKFMDSMLKMQEKVYNVQQIQRFQEAVFEVLQKHHLKQEVVEKLLELPL